MPYPMIFENLETRSMMSADLFAAGGPAVAPAASPAVTVNATATAPAGISAYSWHQTAKASSIKALVWASLDLDPTAEARRVAPLLAGRAPGDRSLFLWHSMISPFVGVDSSNAAATLASGLNISHEVTWAGTFFSELKALGAPVDRVATDAEGNLSTWVLFSGTTTTAQQQAVMQSFYSNPGVLAIMPASVKAFSPADYVSPTTGAAAFIAWNDWTNNIVNDAWHAAVVVPLQANYGPSVQVSNFQQTSAPIETFDGNGWPATMPTDDVVGTVNSPATSLMQGQRYQSMGKDWRWNRLIDVINTVRAAQMTPGTTTIPWLTVPSYRGDSVAAAKGTWLWEQMVRHIAADGVKSVYYFNPVETVSGVDDQFAAALFSSITPAATAPAGLGQIAFDADEIVTGNVVTTYAEFLKYVDQPGATDMQPAATTTGTTSAGKTAGAARATPDSTPGQETTPASTSAAHHLKHGTTKTAGAILSKTHASTFFSSAAAVFSPRPAGGAVADSALTSLAVKGIASTARAAKPSKTKTHSMRIHHSHARHGRRGDVRTVELGTLVGNMIRVEHAGDVRAA